MRPISATSSTNPRRRHGNRAGSIVVGAVEVTTRCSRTALAGAGELNVWVIDFGLTPETPSYCTSERRDRWLRCDGGLRERRRSQPVIMLVRTVSQTRANALSPACARPAA